MEIDKSITTVRVPRVDFYLKSNMPTQKNNIEMLIKDRLVI